MRTIRALLLTAALPLAVAAQNPAPAGPPSDPMTASMRGRMTVLYRNLGMAFDSIPANLYGYKPTPAQQSIGYIAQHLANDNYFFCNNFGEMKASRPADETSTPDSVKAGWPKDSLVRQLKASFDFCQRAFAQLNDASLAQQTALTFRGQTRNVTRAGMVLGHAMDMSDHYSQIANYMRLNGMLPPTALPRPGRNQE